MPLLIALLGCLTSFLLSVMPVVSAQDLTAQDLTARGSQAATDAELAAIRAIGPEAAGYEAATAAAGRLAQRSSEDATAILEAMKDASPLAKNWLRMIASDVADNGEFPMSSMLAFLRDRSQDGDARHAAYQMLISVDGDLRNDLLTGAEDDPSLPLRYLAIGDRLEEAKRLVDEDKLDQAIEAFQIVVALGRNPDQLRSAADSLEKLGVEVDLANELALVRRWWVIGTFDNTDSESFATIYAPEAIYLESGRLPSSWLRDATPIGATDAAAVVRRVTSDDSFGMVNLNPAMDNAKDAIAYAYAELEFTADELGARAPLAAEARLGCINASKVWVNGKLVTANEVYHSGTRIDQYVGDCVLVPGTNTVLIKVCQNAQTEPWAQDWQFQFRLTDPTGTAIRPASIQEPKP